MPEVKTRRDWRISVALLVVLMAALGGWGGVLQDVFWWLIVLGECMIVLGAAAATRVFTESRVLPSLVSIAAAVFALEMVTVPTSTFFGVPTGDTMAAWSQLWFSGVASIQAQATPAVVDEGILFLLCLGAAVLALLADLVAIAFRRAAGVGLLLLPLVLAAPAIGRGSVDVFWLVVTALAFLYLLASSHSVRERAVPGRRAWDAAAIAAAALVAALVLPVLLPTPQQLSVAGAGGAGSIVNGVNPIIRLGDDLRREDERVALTYSTETGDQHYLRLMSLAVFGDNWSQQPNPIGAPGSDEPAPAPEGVSGDVPRSPETSFIEVEQLGGSWLPIPYPATAVDGLRNDAQWQANLALRSGSRSIQGETFTVDSLVLEPTPEQLLAAGSSVPEEVAEFAVADEAWPAIIRDTATAVAGSAATNYERAVALQQFFRSGGDFSYSESAPVDEGYDGSGAEVIGAFLQAKSGYCVHFASAMALMARTLGIPSRVAVGFLPGSSTGGRDDAGRPVWEVTSQQLHAWPELFFEGIGWVPFEPTTSRGVLPSYSSGQTPGVPTPAAPSQVPSPGATAPSPSSGAPERPDRKSVV